MIFDIFKSVSAKGVECTQEVFLAAIHGESLIPLYNKIAAETDSDKRQALKRQLPAMTYQAHFPDGKRSNASAIMSGLFMIDIDHIEDPYALYSEKVAGRTEELDIVLVHMTPSTKGLRIVAKCRREFSSIAENQAWLAKELGVEQDEACKDAARLSYLVPFSYFYFMDQAGLFGPADPELLKNLNAYDTTHSFQPHSDNAGAGNADTVDRQPAVNKTTEYTENNLNHESHKSTRISQSSGQVSGNYEHSVNKTTENTENTENMSGNSEYSVVEKEKIREDSCNSWLNKEPYLYRGTRLKDIAERYVSHFGGPVQGERHTYYYKMCAYFKYICDCDKAVLLAELPDFGLTLAERKSECDHACSKPTGGSIPKEFYFFLTEIGVLETAAAKAKREEAERLLAALEDDDADVDGTEDNADLPKFPPVFSSFARISPSDFVVPQAYVLMPTLGALMHVKAQYLDGKFHTPTFHNVIYAPAGTGKSYARATVERLTKHIAKRDKENELLELANQDAKQKAKNEKKQPESVVLPKRRQMGTFSQPKLLKRQRANGEMHTLVYLEEIDTLMKSKRGYGGMDLSDMFRVAFDNATYSQDVVCDTTFNGEVDLFLNFCVTGTEDQLMRCYKNPDDGLVTRIGLCPIRNQEYAETPIWKCLTKKDEDIIEACLDFADTLTYETDEEGVEHILERTDITEEVKFMYPVLNNWLEEKRMQALKSQDRALDIFRRRVAVKMFRLAMVCWGCYCGKLNKEREDLIKSFCIWWGEQDLQNLLDMYGEMVNEKPKEKHNIKEDMFAQLPAIFSAGDVEGLRLQNGLSTPTRFIICQWKQAGLIRKEFKSYIKILE